MREGTGGAGRGRRTPLAVRVTRATSTRQGSPQVVVAGQALENGVVLAVHQGSRREPLARAAGHDELAGEDQDFLAGEGERSFSAASAASAGCEAGGADEAATSTRSASGSWASSTRPLGAAAELRAGREQVFRAGPGVGDGVAERGVAHAEVAGDARERRPRCGRRGDADKLELVAVRGDHAQGVLADGQAGGAEQDDAFSWKRLLSRERTRYLGRRAARQKQNRK